MRPSHLALIVVVAMLPAAARAQAQPPAKIAVAHPELIEGPWEASGPSGIEGIFFQIGTSYVDKNIRQVEVTRNGRRAATVIRMGEPKIELTGQRVQVAIYHREQGRNEKISLEEQYDSRWFVEHFDGERLHVRPVLPHTAPLGGGFELNVTFSHDAKRWTGTLARGGQVVQLTFERPHPAGAKPSIAVGDWEATPEQPRTPRGILHIRQSSDGVLTAWLDRLNVFSTTPPVPAPGTRGTPLTVTFKAPASLELVDEVASCFGGAAGDCVGTYRGAISENGKGITGSWQRFAGDGPARLENFTRIQPEPR